jgi:hypothetical protein
MRGLAGQRIDRIGGSTCFGRGGNRLLHRLDAQLLKEFSLAAVASVEAGDAHAGVSGDQRYRRCRSMAGEDLAGGIEESLVVAYAFGVTSTPAGCVLGHGKIVRIAERVSPG